MKEIVPLVTKTHIDMMKSLKQDTTSAIMPVLPAADKSYPNGGSTNLDELMEEFEDDEEADPSRSYMGPVTIKVEVDQPQR